MARFTYYVLWVGGVNVYEGVDRKEAVKWQKKYGGEIIKRVEGKQKA